MTRINLSGLCAHKKISPEAATEELKLRKGWYLAMAAMLLAFFFLAIPGCSPSDEQRMTSLRHEVVAIHDGTMARMGSMYELEMELTNILEKRRKENHPTGRQQAAISALIEAQKAMLDWMHQYREPAEDSPAHEATLYFEEQKAKIIEVRRLTNQAIRDAEAVLNH